jgi:hypothetical protein
MKPGLVPALNALLASLNISSTVSSPTDLTPPLLLTILESVLGCRLPIPISIRDSDEVQSVKIFLGVLESDVLKMDVGLSNIDPRRLAQVEEKECVFIGELLCWLARKRRLGQDRKAVRIFSDNHDRLRTPSPSAHSSMTHSVVTNLSMHAQSDITETSLASGAVGSQAAPNEEPTKDLRCIHELEDSLEVTWDPSTDASRLTDVVSCCHCYRDEDDVEPTSSFCQCVSPPTPTLSAVPTPVRRAGYINTVDSELEISAFELSRSPIKSRRRTVATVCPPASFFGNWSILLKPAFQRSHSHRAIAEPCAEHVSPTEHTVALLNQRAYLLAELARLKAR